VLAASEGIADSKHSQDALVAHKKKVSDISGKVSEDMKLEPWPASCLFDLF
jgi:hypothetical protein